MGLLSECHTVYFSIHPSPAGCYLLRVMTVRSTCLIVQLIDFGMALLQPPGTWPSCTSTSSSGVRGTSGSSPGHRRRSGCSAVQTVHPAVPSSASPRQRGCACGPRRSSSSSSGGSTASGSFRAASSSSTSSSEADDDDDDEAAEVVLEIVGTECFVAPEVLVEQRYSPAVE